LLRRFGSSNDGLFDIRNFQSPGFAIRDAAAQRRRVMQT
jgi:hypothetical protein